MEIILGCLVSIPLLSFLLSNLISSKMEKLLVKSSIFFVILQFVFFIIITFYWIFSNFKDLYYKGFTLYSSERYNFSLDFYFDHISLIYYLVSFFLMFLVMIYSRFYLHREKGFKRFFVNMNFFYTGLCLIIFSGNFETLLIGWEIIGMSSFFLISFYRERYLPVKNALKVVSVYRIADIFLLFSIWLCHHYFNKSINFLELSQSGLILLNDYPYNFIIPFMFLVVAAVKSAQFPFSFWLPRAMEGPTTSSAIFYGSLSVHIGVFLMIRISPLWQGYIPFHTMLFLMGLFTIVMSTTTARVQSSIKTQIAYSSISQIGIIFIEISLGFYNLAIMHFACNAILRTYQLLVSPSVLTYLIHDQFFNFIKPNNKIENNFIGKIKATIFIISLKEWNMDSFMYHFIWKKIKKVGNSINFINANSVLFIFTPLYFIGIYFVFNIKYSPSYVTTYFPVIIAIISLLMAIKSFVKRSEANKSWFLITVSQMYLGLSISFNEQFEFSQLAIFLSGIFISAFIGYLCIYKLKFNKENIKLDNFHGYSLKYPALGIIFLLSSLGLAGFPITPTFIGEDIMLGHIHENQFFLTIIIFLTLIIDGLSIFRIYSRLFNGPAKDTNYEVAYRSS